MIKREELLKTEEYWFETLQNEIYRMVADYIEKEDLNQTQLADKLGVSKGYISQILNGNFNYTLKKLIELSLAVNKVPSLDFITVNEFIKKDRQKRFEMKYNQFFVQNIEHKPKSTRVYSGNTGNFTIVKPSNYYSELKVA